MELYLSSYRLGTEPQKLKELVGENKKAAVISNALDFSDDIARKRESIQREIEDLNALGLQAEELDLRDYFGKPEDLNDKIDQLGMVWAVGGNSFILRRAMRQSGLDDILKKYHQDKKEFVYSGYSAGACVVTPTLHGIELADEPDIIPAEYDSGIIWDGLGFVDYSIAPHYRSNHSESDVVDEVVKYYQENNMPYKAISDGEVIIVRF